MNPTASSPTWSRSGGGRSLYLLISLDVMYLCVSAGLTCTRVYCLFPVLWNQQRSCCRYNSSSCCSGSSTERKLDRWSVGGSQSNFINTSSICWGSAARQWALLPHSMMVLGLISDSGFFFFVDFACSPPHPCGFLLVLRLPCTIPKPVISFNCCHIIAHKCEGF